MNEIIKTKLMLVKMIGEATSFAGPSIYDIDCEILLNKELCLIEDIKVKDNDLYEINQTRYENINIYLEKFDKEFDFNILLKNGKLIIEDNEDYNEFKLYLLHQKFNNKISSKNLNKKTLKL